MREWDTSLRGATGSKYRDLIPFKVGDKVTILPNMKPSDDIERMLIAHQIICEIVYINYDTDVIYIQNGDYIGYEASIRLSHA